MFLSSSLYQPSRQSRHSFHLLLCEKPAYILNRIYLFTNLLYVYTARKSIHIYEEFVCVKSVKGAEELEYRIETKEAFCIVGVSCPHKREIEKNFAVVPQMWQNAATNGMLDTPPMGLLGVCACRDAGEI